MASQFIQITLPDGTRKQVPAGCTVRDAVSPDGKRLDQKILAAKVNGTPVDLFYPLDQDATVELLTFESAEGREVYRHSSTHIMAQAVKEVFPTAQLTIGPALEDGFYYDFAFDRPFTPKIWRRLKPAPWKSRSEV
ncbi:MAG: TGS domain-containing protein [Nitrospira sp.]|nr:TGS domain-containing protein [Nitrospira sp.]